MNYRTGKQKYGQIKAGQRWRRRENGRMMVIFGRCQKGWRVHFDGNSRGKKSHSILEADIYKYYDKVDA